MENRTIYNSECENEITGVINNMTTASAEEMSSDDFDKLLDDFIRESLNDNDETDEDDTDDLDYCDSGFDDEDDDSDDDEVDDYGSDDDDVDELEDDDAFKEFDYGCVEYKPGRVNYILPACPDNLCKASKLVMTYDAFEGQQLRGEPIVFTNDGSSSRIYFTLHEITHFNSDAAPVLYVYSANESYPLFRYRFEMDDESSREGMASLIELLDAIPTGNYFFYFWGVEIKEMAKHCVNIGGGYCIPFVHVAKNEYLPKIALENIDAKVERNNSINFSLRFDSMLDKRYGFQLYMYNRSYNLIARGATFVWDKFGTRKRKKLNTVLTASFPLFGEYITYILQNGTPIYKVNISIDNGKIVSIAQSDVKPFGKEYLMLVELEQRNCWHVFRELSAPISIKEYFLSTYERQNLNRLRSSKGLNTLDIVSHFVYNGGSSTIELKALEKMCNMFRGISCFKSADCIELTEAKNAVDPYSDATELFEDPIGECVALYNISALVGGGAVVVKKILDAIGRSSTFSLCLIGNTSEVAQLFECYPQLKHFFPVNNCIPAGKMYAETLVVQVLNELEKCDLFLSPQAQALLLDTARKAEEAGSLYHLTEVAVSEFVKSGIVNNFISRTMSTLDSRRADDKAFLSTIEACDIDRDMLVKGTEQEFEDSIKELNEMVGLNDVKKNIITNFNRLKNNAERRRLGLKVKSGECHHMIFTGNPGTGKTTVAKMMGRIYHALGLLSKGDVVYTDRSKIVGRYIGDTERNMQRILLEAKGNILFIDEAYTLCDSLQDRKDFGYRAIECLLTVMAQENCDMIVIFAGYSKEMDKMMLSNQGLQGRFPYKFEFKDYTADELMQIAEYKLSQEDYELTDEARALLRKTIDEAVDNKGWAFSNARWIEQYVNNGIIPAQSDRLMLCNNAKNRDDYRCVCVEDVRVAYNLYKPQTEVKKVYREIGFTA